MGLQALLKNATKLVLMGLGGVLGAAVMVWARANSDWVTIRIPSVMVPGSGEPIEYEAQVWGIVALSFAGGVLSCIWIALAVWLRSVQRERRLARVLEQVEEQIRASRTPGLLGSDEALALPASRPSWRDLSLREFDELDPEDDHELLANESDLPEGYDELDEHGDDDGDRGEGEDRSMKAVGSSDGRHS